MLPRLPAFSTRALSDAVAQGARLSTLQAVIKAAGFRMRLWNASTGRRASMLERLQAGKDIH